MEEDCQERRDYSGLIAAICFLVIFAVLASYGIKQLIPIFNQLSVIFN